MHLLIKEFHHFFFSDTKWYVSYIQSTRKTFKWWWKCEGFLTYLLAWRVIVDPTTGTAAWGVSATILAGICPAACIALYWRGVICSKPGGGTSQYKLGFLRREDFELLRFNGAISLERLRRLFDWYLSRERDRGCFSRGDLDRCLLRSAEMKIKRLYENFTLKMSTKICLLIFTWNSRNLHFTLWY